MSYQKPLVTIELEEYNKMLEYIKLLDDSIGSNCSKYKTALQEIVDMLDRNRLEINYQLSPTEAFKNLIFTALAHNEITIDHITRKIN